MGSGGKLSLYSKKQRWKMGLLFLSILLVAAALWASHSIVDNLAEREKNHVATWGQTMERKAALVRLTNNTFEELRHKERERMALWASALSELSNEHKDYTFFSNIIRDSTGIPAILVDERGIPFSWQQLEEVENYYRGLYPANDSLFHAKMVDTCLALIEKWGKENDPITVSVFQDTQRIYYTDSKKLSQLQFKRDSLIESFRHELIDTDILPVLFVNAAGDSIIASNLHTELSAEEQIKSIKEKWQTRSIPIDLGAGEEGTIYYQHSSELQFMKYFPWVLLALVSLFVVIGYLMFSTFRRAEQNRVWVGMAKETAHQLGTPISSLMAWSQLLEAKGADPDAITEINKDIQRLEMITNRFSKIGSEVPLHPEKLLPLTQNMVDYLRTRISRKVAITVTGDDPEATAKVNTDLFGWVIENICKNAVDAMKGEGRIDIHIGQTQDQVYIDISDNGPGLPPGKSKTVFQPGFSTKKRGWGLGLTLVKRIVEERHGGKVYVLNTEQGKGTTFRIELEKV